MLSRIICFVLSFLCIILFILTRDSALIVAGAIFVVARELSKINTNLEYKNEEIEE